jgi:hypothetical protein
MPAVCFRYASNKRAGNVERSSAKMRGINLMTLGDYSPEKAGVGGSTPSRGTIRSATYKPPKSKNLFQFVPKIKSRPGPKFVSDACKYGPPGLEARAARITSILLRVLSPSGYKILLRFVAQGSFLKLLLGLTTGPAAGDRFKHPARLPAQR